MLNWVGENLKTRKIWLAAENIKRGEIERCFVEIAENK